jgi:hypothetical protein
MCLFVIALVLASPQSHAQPQRKSCSVGTMYYGIGSNHTTYHPCYLLCLSKAFTLCSCRLSSIASASRFSSCTASHSLPDTCRQVLPISRTSVSQAYSQDPKGVGLCRTDGIGLFSDSYVWLSCKRFSQILHPDKHASDSVKAATYLGLSRHARPLPHRTEQRAAGRATACWRARARSVNRAWFCLASLWIAFPPPIWP